MYKRLDLIPVESISVSVPKTFDDFIRVTIGTTEYLDFRDRSGFNIGLEMLPNGHWEVIGRCNEEFSLNQFAKMGLFHYTHENIKYWWNDYKERNNLTNELILIHPTNSR